MEKCAEQRITADDYLGDLLMSSTVVVPLTRVQHGRWKKAADAMGARMDQFVKVHVEAALHGGNASLIEKTFYTVRALAQKAGVKAVDGLQGSTDDLQQ